jgi:glycosyltransferase involved in cell wall biosynthesis
MPRNRHSCTQTSALLRVWIYTPLGRGGEGGIDRLTDEIREVMAGGAAPTNLRLHYVTTRGRRSIAYSGFFLFGALLQTVVAGTFGHIDVAHVNLAAFGSTWRKWIVTSVLRLLAIPYVVHIHGSDFLESWDSGSKGLNRAIRQILGNSAQIITLGDAWNAPLVKRMPALADRITRLFNASKSFDGMSESDEQYPEIVFLGRLGARKGVPELITALEFLKALPSWHATFAGDGAVDETRFEVAKRGLSSRITVNGWLDESQVQSLLRRASILALPSHMEVLPMAIIEGFAHGLAVVTTPVGVIAEIVNSETGILVQPGNVDELRVALENLINDKALRRRIGSGAKAFHDRELNIDIYVARLSEVWLKVADWKKEESSARR